MDTHARRARRISPRIALTALAVGAVLALVGARWFLSPDAPRDADAVPPPVARDADATSVPDPIRGYAPRPTPSSSSGTARTAQDSSVRSAPLIGRVVDERDQPIAGAEVTAGPRGVHADTGAPEFVLAFDPGLSRTVHTGADGTFRIEGLGVGVVDVVARAPARMPAAHANVVLAAHAIPALELRLVSGRSLEGRVTSTNGQPIAEAHVAIAVLDWRAADAAMRETLTREVQTDAEGRFRLDGLLTGRPLRALASARGFLDGEAVRVGPDERSLAIRLEPAPVVLLRVLDQDSGTPLPAAIVEIANAAGTFAANPRTLLRGEEAATRLGRALPPDAVLCVDQTQRRARFRVTADGYATAWIDVTAVGAGEVRERLVELEPEARLVGRVNAADGAPVAGAEILARHVGGADVLDVTSALVAGDLARVDPLSGRGPSLRPDVLVATTDAQGRFEFRGLGAGAYRVTVRVDEHDDLVAPLDAELARGANELLPIVLPARATLACTVLDAEGRPVAGVVVAVKPWVEGGDSGRFLESLVEPLAVAETDATGKVTIAWLPLGRVVVRARARGALRPEEDGRAEVELRASGIETTIRMPAVEIR